MSSFDCPVCLEVLKPQIKSCSNGHAVCGDCQKKVQSCPECRADLVYRNLTLEKVLQEIPLPCSNTGCEFKGTRQALVPHKKLCFYRKVACFIVDCPDVENSKFHLNLFSGHLPEKHKDDINLMDINATKDITFTVANSEIGDVELLELSDSKDFFIYLFSLEVETKELNADVRYVGKSEDADKFMYTLTIDQGMGDKLDKFTYTNYCMPHYEYSNDIPIPYRRFNIGDYRHIFHEDLTNGDKVHTSLKISAAPKPPVEREA